MNAMQVQLAQSQESAQVSVIITEKTLLSILSDSASSELDSAVYSSVCALDGLLSCTIEPQARHRALSTSASATYSVQREYDASSNASQVPLQDALNQGLQSINASVASMQTIALQATSTITAIGSPDSSSLSGVRFDDANSAFQQQLLSDVSLQLAVTQSAIVVPPGPPPTLPPLEPPALPPMQPTVQSSSAITAIAVAASVGGFLAVLVLVFLTRNYWWRPWRPVLPKAPPKVAPFRSQAASQAPPVSSGDYTSVDTGDGRIGPVTTTTVTQLIDEAEIGRQQDVVILRDYNSVNVSDAEEVEHRQAAEPTIVRIDPSTVSPRAMTPASAAQHGLMEGGQQEPVECIPSSAITDASAAADTVKEQSDLEAAVVAGDIEGALLKYSSDVVGGFEADVGEGVVDDQNIDPSSRPSRGREVERMEAERVEAERLEAEIERTDAEVEKAEAERMEAEKAKAVPDLRTRDDADGGASSGPGSATKHDGNQARQQGEAMVLGSLVGPASPGSYTAVGQQQEGSAAHESARLRTRALNSSARHMARVALVAKRLREEDGDAPASEAHEASHFARVANLTMVASKLKDVEKSGSLTKPSRLPPPPPAASAPDNGSLIKGLMKERLSESNVSLVRETRDVEPGQDGGGGVRCQPVILDKRQDD